MTNAKSPMTKESPNPNRQNLATRPARRSCLEFRAWSFFGPWSLVLGPYSTSAGLSVLLTLASVSAAISSSVAPDQTGKLVELQFQPLPAAEKATPPVLHLRGKDARQQLLVTAKFDSGAVRDYTRR